MRTCPRCTMPLPSTGEPCPLLGCQRAAFVARARALVDGAPWPLRMLAAFLRDFVGALTETAKVLWQMRLAILVWLIVTPATLLGCELLKPALSILDAINRDRATAGAEPLPSAHPDAVAAVKCDVEVRDALELERLRARVADLERADPDVDDAQAVARARTIIALGRRARAVRRAKAARVVAVDGGAL